MQTYLDEIISEINTGQSKPGVESDANWIDSLPLVICGPILRKVHYDNVSVWLAFKEEVSDIRLYVFDANDRTAIVNGKSRLTGSVTSPLKLGKNLFVTLVTATSKTQKLKADTIYGYNIYFTHNGVQKQLGYRDVLKNGILSVSYHPFSYPTFCLPADNINNLKIVHGSCRMPHGGKTDALRALDTMLEVNKMDVTQRPQLLCLTGDQIYADDVSDMLLYKIIKAQKKLFGWKEVLPKTYTDNQLLPGNRKDIIARTGNKNKNWGFSSRAITPDDLTTTDADSHLIFFSEFMLMYLFTFSDTLWYDTNPGWKELYPDFIQPKTTAEARVYIEKFERRSKSFASDKIALGNFLKSLPFVKKALANVSTLMILDDHEITDDLFITKEWSRVALLKGTTSRRYILNALLAYAVFQDWGNDHMKYLSGDGAYILNALNVKNPNGYTRAIAHHSISFTHKIESIVLPALAQDTQNTKETSWYLKSRFKWNYQVKYNSFDLIVLNTRTERQYYDKEFPLANLAKTVSAGGSYNFDKLAIVVSPVPVFANLPLETVQEQAREGNTDLVTGILARKTDNIGMFQRDQESWSFSGRGFSRLLYFLSMFKRVLILSGDVHHAFTSYVKLWRETAGGSYHLTQIAHSTSSSLKHSTEGTHYPAINKYDFGPDPGKVFKRLKVLGVTKPGEKPRVFPNPRFQDPQEYNPLRTRVKLESISTDPYIQFTVKYIRSAGYGLSKPEGDAIMRTRQSGIFNDRSSISPVPLTAVGKDNISLISFTPYSITSRIWLANGDPEKPDDKEMNRLLFPYLSHVVDFRAPWKIDELPSVEFKKYIAQHTWRGQLI